MPAPYFAGYEFGFVCDCNEREVGNSYIDLDEAVVDGDVVECPYCGTEWEVAITKVKA